MISSEKKPNLYSMVSALPSEGIFKQTHKQLKGSKNDDWDHRLIENSDFKKLTKGNADNLVEKYFTIIYKMLHVISLQDVLPEFRENLH